MQQKLSKIHSISSGRKQEDVRKAVMNAAKNVKSAMDSGNSNDLLNAQAEAARILTKFGFGGDPLAVKNNIATMNSAAAPQVTGSIGIPEMFLLAGLPGYVSTIVSPWRAAQIMGKTIIGNVFDSRVYIRSIEEKGDTSLYGDESVVTKSSYDFGFVTRNIVRFSSGVTTGAQRDYNQAAGGFPDYQINQKAMRRAFGILLNAIGLNGYLSGSNGTYGLLNDPNLPASTVVPNGASTSPLWSTKTFGEMYLDVQLSLSDLATNTDGSIDIYNDEVTWLVSPAIYALLGTVPSQYPLKTLIMQIKETYTGLRVISVPEMATSHAGSDGWMFYADKAPFNDDSTDGGLSVLNTLQSEEYLLSSLPNQSGGVDENYICATSGALVTRPLLFTLWHGM